LIAAHALAADLLLVTANAREFQHVPALRVENWSISGCTAPLPAY
jgi:tRNA(fMet)-specific endonuclease VapC